MERIEQLKVFLQDEPEDNFLLHALALEHVKAGNTVEARRIFESILTRDPAYVASYYQLAKLLESESVEDLALIWYQKGMEAAKQAGDKHAYNELKAAYEELAF